MKMLTAAALTAAVLTASCAPTAPSTGAPASASAPRQCFFTSQVHGFSAPDERRVYVDVGVRDVYELEMLGGCPNIDWSWQIGIQPPGAGTSVCTGFDADLIVPQTGGGTWRCPVRSVRKLTVEEAKALQGR
ncbi:MAG TPA: DUF6491 family protein [Caulobacteraceae bacterium]|nr:DUF6491 family protein [Caulobacteraceae bacterium]